jgi:hypothetical protein
MAELGHYKVETSHGTVEFDARPGLTKDEIQLAVNQNHPEGSFNVPPALQGAADIVTMPGRGMRGIGVGLEQMLLGKGIQPALQRASAATQPGYQAQPGEKLGSFAGGMLDPLNLAANAVLPGGTLLKSIGGGAMAAAGNSALDQAAQGHVNPGEVGIDAALGGVTGGAVHGIAHGAEGFLKAAPGIFEKISSIPRRATQILERVPGLQKLVSGTEQSLENKTVKIQETLQQMHDDATAYFQKALRDPKIKADLNNSEKVISGKDMPVLSIPGAVETMKRTLPMIIQQQKDKPEATAITSDVFKTLLHIRQSIDHWVNYAKGNVPDVGTIQSSGLKGLRQEVQGMIGQLPGGEILLNASSRLHAAKDIFEELQPKLKHTGDAIEFLKDTFAMKGNNHKENMMKLLALEEITGKPVVQDMFKALTVSHFSPKFAGGVISRAVAGISPFLASALLRAAGLPFQASLILSAAGVTLARSPRLQGVTVKAARDLGPSISKMAKPTATAALAAIRQRWADEGK